jgi:hypothetical protein
MVGNKYLQMSQRHQKMYLTLIDVITLTRIPWASVGEQCALERDFAWPDGRTVSVATISSCNPTP